MLHVTVLSVTSLTPMVDGSILREKQYLVSSR